jgi:hypothetical protein
MTSPWKTMPGRYTAEGDVRPLLVAVDDRFVVARPGDEIALGFDAAALRPVAAGWTRTFLLYANGFSKEMDVNSASPDHVGPLPFHGMTGYPAAAGRTRSERDDTAARVVTTPVPSTDAILLRARPPHAADAPKPARPPFR